MVSMVMGTHVPAALSTNTLQPGRPVLLLLPTATAVELVLILMDKQGRHLVLIVTMVTMELDPVVGHVQLTNTHPPGQPVLLQILTVYPVDLDLTQTARQGRHLVPTATMVTMETGHLAQLAQRRSFQQHGALV